MKTIKVLLVVLISFSFQKLFAQPGLLPTPYCMPLYNMCPCNQPGPSNQPGAFVNDFIHSVITTGANTDINNLNTGCNSQNFPSIGIRNYIFHQCQHNLSVSPGQAVTFSIQIGNDYAQGIAVFIDWNLDNIFQSPSEMVASTPGTIAGGGWANLTVNIPPAQPNGIYRMRIRCARLINGSTIDPCIQYTYGEVEDYIVCVGNTSPVITATATSNSTLCAGNTLSLNVNYTSQCTPSFTWVGPNNFTTNNQNNTIANAQPIMSGNYTVMLNCGLCPITATTNVVVDAVPPLTVTPNYTAVCTGFNSTITASGANTYTWTGTTFTGSVIQPTIAAPSGNYSVVATWTNNSCISSTAVSISSLAPLSVTVTPSSTVVCKGPVPYSIILTANSPGAQAFVWGPCSGPSGAYLAICIGNSVMLGSSNLTVGSVIVFTVGAYSAVCSGSAALTVSVVASPTITPVSSSSLICAGNQATLSASGANSYTWNPGGTGSVIAVNPTITTQYTVTGSDGVCSSNATITQSVMVCAGIDSKEMELDGIKIYPNPFKDELKISCIKKIEIKIVDVAGKLVLQKEIDKDSIINTQTFAKGIYLLYVNDGVGSKSIKVIKD